MQMNEFWNCFSSNLWDVWISRMSSSHFTLEIKGNLFSIKLRCADNAFFFSCNWYWWWIMYVFLRISSLGDFEEIMHNYHQIILNGKYNFLLLLILEWNMTRTCSGCAGEIQPCSRMHFCQCIHVQLYRCVHVHKNTCMLVLCLCESVCLSVCLSERDWDFNTCLIW